MPTGHGVSLVLGDAGAGKSTPDIVIEGRGKLRGNPMRFSQSCTVKKILLSLNQQRPYRKPTLVGEGNSPKVNERTFVKELGNLAP